MNINEMRRGSRRSSLDNRINDRRHIDYPFGSPEWEENMKKFYLVWPKNDRRVSIRRSDERRTGERRLQQASEQQRSNQRFNKIVLTQEERGLIEDLFLNDIEDWT